MTGYDLFDERTKKQMRKALFFLLCASIGLNSYCQVKAHLTKEHLPKVLDEPLFDISYDPLVVHYQPVPSNLQHICRNGYEHEFVYAHIKSGNSDYYIISGYSSDQDGDSLGYIALVGESRCDTSDLGNAYSGIPPENGYKETSIVERVPGKNAPDIRNPGESGLQGNYHYVLRSAHEEFVLRSLVKDALQRGIQAFGSEDRFRRLVCSPEKVKGLSYYPNIIEEEELKSFCSRFVTNSLVPHK
jgi:hypothetical protein